MSTVASGTPKRKSRANAVLQKAGLVLTSLLVTLVALEIAGRVFLRVTDNERTVLLDATRGWRLAPNVYKRYVHEEEPHLIVTNSRGLRDREYSYAKPPGKFRVVVLGDSMTFGAGGVENDEMFTELLEESDPRLEVINLGVPAYSTDQQFLYLKQEGLRYEPDMVILVMYINDFALTFWDFDPSIRRPKGHFTIQDGRLEFHAPEYGLLYRLTGPSVLFSIVDAGLRRLGWGQYDASKRGAVIPEGKRSEIFALILEEMWNACQEIGSEFAVVYIPSKSARIHPLFEVVKSTALRSDFPIVDMTGPLLEGPADESPYFKRDIHINRAGHALVAQTIAERLIQPALEGR